MAMSNPKGPEQVINYRAGSVLGKNTILKSDHFPGCQNKRLSPQIEGAPNYWQVRVCVCVCSFFVWHVPGIRIRIRTRGCLWFLLTCRLGDLCHHDLFVWFFEVVFTLKINRLGPCVFMVWQYLPLMGSEMYQITLEHKRTESKHGFFGITFGKNRQDFFFPLCCSCCCCCCCCCLALVVTVTCRQRYVSISFWITFFFLIFNSDNDRQLVVIHQLISLVIGPLLDCSIRQSNSYIPSTS